MYAAGMTLKEENYKTFKDAFEKEVQRTIHPDMLTPEIAIDAEIDFADITPKLIRILKQFEPYGPQNMTPIFLTKNIKDTGYGKPLGQEDEHLKLFVKQNNADGLAAIGFNLGNKIELTTHQKPFQVVYCIDENEWKGKLSLQLRLRDIKE
jgi:single-stranded-DNA-specific exonuclease